MSKVVIDSKQFFDEIDTSFRSFAQDLHDYLTESGCKASFEEKKTGLFGGYKHPKTKKSLVNMLYKKQGLLVRIYGGHTSGYRPFLDTLPAEMVKSIKSASPCKKLIDNSCNLKCTGYDFTIGGEHFQKCIYNCFEFLVTEESKPFIAAFVRHEVEQIERK